MKPSQKFFPGTPLGDLRDLKEEMDREIESSFGGPVSGISSGIIRIIKEDGSEKAVEILEELVAWINTYEAEKGEEDDE